MKESFKKGGSDGGGGGGGGGEEEGNGGGEGEFRGTTGESADGTGSDWADKSDTGEVKVADGGGGGLILGFLLSSALFPVLLTNKFLSLISSSVRCDEWQSLGVVNSYESFVEWSITILGFGGIWGGEILDFTGVCSDEEELFKFVGFFGIGGLIFFSFSKLFISLFLSDENSLQFISCKFISSLLSSIKILLVRLVAVVDDSKCLKKVLTKKYFIKKCLIKKTFSAEFVS